MITDILWNVTQALHAKGIISFEVKDQILTAKGEGDNKKAIYLLHVLQRQLEAHSDPDQYLVNICNVLINQQQQTLTDIAISILQQLGQFVILLIIFINIFISQAKLFLINLHTVAHQIDLHTVVHQILLYNHC